MTVMERHPMGVLSCSGWTRLDWWGGKARDLASASVQPRWRICLFCDTRSSFRQGGRVTLSKKWSLKTRALSVDVISPFRSMTSGQTCNRLVATFDCLTSLWQRHTSIFSLHNGKLPEMQGNNGAWLNTRPCGCLHTGTIEDTIHIRTSAH